MSRRGPGLARLQTLMENLKREINWGGSTISGQLGEYTQVEEDITLTSAQSKSNLFVPLDDQAIAIMLPSATIDNIGWSTTVRTTPNLLGNPPTNSLTVACSGGSDLLGGHLWNYSSAAYWYYYFYTGIYGDSGKGLFIPDGANDNAVIMNSDVTGWGPGGTMKFTIIAENLVWVEGILMSLPEYIPKKKFGYYANAQVATPFDVFP